MQVWLSVSKRGWLTLALSGAPREGVPCSAAPAARCWTPCHPVMVTVSVVQEPSHARGSSVRARGYGFEPPWAQGLPRSGTSGPLRMVSRYGTSAASCCCIASTIAVAPPIIVRSRFMMLMSSDGACVCVSAGTSAASAGMVSRASATLTERKRFIRPPFSVPNSIWVDPHNTPGSPFWPPKSWSRTAGYL